MSTIKLIATAMSAICVVLVGCVDGGGGNGGGGVACPSLGMSGMSPNCFIVDVHQPNPPNDLGFEYRGAGGEAPLAETMQDPPPNSGDLQTIELYPWVGENGEFHPDTHTHDTGDDPGNHCHYWVRFGGTWYQLHC